MIKLSDLIGKPLLDISKASVFTVGNVLFDYKRNSAVAVEVICPDDDCEYKYIKFGDIYKIEDAVTVKSSACFFGGPKKDYAPNPINLDAYSQSGKLFGKIKDVILDGPTLKSFVIGDKEMMFPVVSASDRLIIFNDTGKPFILPKPKVHVADNRNVRIALNPSEKNSAKERLDDRQQAADTAYIETPYRPDATTVIHSPKNTPITKYEFLLGKRADKDIFSNNGKLIVGINEIITSDIILSAKDEGKLVQLAMHSR